MKNTKVETQYHFHELFLMFFVASCVGWLYETILEVLVYHTGFSNRGVLWGPYCPVYGFGALLIYASIHKIYEKATNKLLLCPIVFALSCLISTLVELLASYLCQGIWGTWPWDYSMYSCNFQGRVALNTSLRFAVGGVILIYLVCPLLQELYKRISSRKIVCISFFLLLLICVDTMVLVTKIV